MDLLLSCWERVSLFLFFIAALDHVPSQRGLGPLRLASLGQVLVHQHWRGQCPHSPAHMISCCLMGFWVFGSRKHVPFFLM